MATHGTATMTQLGARNPVSRNLHISAHLRHVDTVKARVLCVPPNSHNRSYDGPRAEGADWMRSSDPKGQLLIIATPLPAAKRVPLRATPRDLNRGGSSPIA